MNNYIKNIDIINKNVKILLELGKNKLLKNQILM